MPQVTLTADEIAILNESLNTSIQSMGRAQKQAKTPQFAQVAKEHELTLKELQAKLGKAK